MTKAVMILMAASALAGCATTASAPPASATYRALGTEPFWSLEIDSRMMRFTTASGEAPVSEPTPRVIHGFAGEIYQGKRIRVNIVHGKCSDGMSDRIYPDSMQLGVDGRSYTGCGGL